VTTARLLAFVYPILALLTFADGPPLLSAALCLAALVAIGELALRALIRDHVSPVARLGLAATAGLITLPLAALVLHVLQLPVQARPLTATVLVLVTGLGAYVLVRDRRTGPPPDRLSPRTLAAVAVPGALAVLVGGGAVVAYQRLPRPAPPGYTSVALNGWAADIRRPVTFPARGLQVPIRVSSMGEPASTVPLRVWVGDRAAGAARPMPIAANSTRSVQVYVPAPPDGCLHRIEISMGPASTVFYGRGPAAC
jgi:hypothetical protein